MKSACVGKGRYYNKPMSISLRENQSLFFNFTTKQTSAIEDVESQEDILENVIFLFSVLGLEATV